MGTALAYIAPAFYRIFAAYTGNTRWTTILDKSYTLLASAQNATSGLVPDWSVGNRTNTTYGYDATRTPFRIALDYCWNGDTRAKTFIQKMGMFFAGVGNWRAGRSVCIVTTAAAAGR